MLLFDWFRSFMPLLNPLGFGAADFLELAATLLLVLLVAERKRLEHYGRRLAAHPRLCLPALAAFSLVLRLAMLPQSPVPTPSGADDFAHLLAADTLRHFRLANPPHPMHRFFETVFVLQEPAYGSIYPPGPGLAMALGWITFGQPWAGVLISMAAFAALCYWMLRAWTSPGWALVGGVLAVIEFGPLRYWTNTYWGGGVSALAGCLIFGSLPRLRGIPRTRDATLLGTGLGLQFLSRPFEGLLLLPCVAAYLLAHRRIRPAVIAAVVMLPALGLMLLQNRQATGNWTTLPYQLSRYQYGIPTTFTVQPNPVPHRALTQAQQLDYEAQVAVHGPGRDSPGAYMARLAERVRFYRFFFPAPLYLALPAFLCALRETRLRIVALLLAVLAVGTNFYPYFYPHYVAAATCLFVLVSVTALERLSRIQINGFAVGVDAARILAILCAGHFLFWYGAHLHGPSTLLEHDTWDFVNDGDPEGRIAINRRLAASAGKQLVFVRYWPNHRFDEWVQNAADIDNAHVVWALDLGETENNGLLRYYPGRRPWLLEPDARPPRLTALPEIVK